MIQPVVKLVMGLGVAVAGFIWLSKSETRQAALQAAFDEFHAAIKHEQFGERALLRQRREQLLQELKDGLPPEFKVEAFDQGSYAMQTGVMPLDGDFDIDLGVVFACEKMAFAGPVAAKRLVRDALAKGTRRVSIRQSCVTVRYAKRGTDNHHVDLAVYATESKGRLWLAKGKEHSQADRCFWESSDPQELTALVNGRFRGESLSQFRRCVRFLKRWKHHHFTSNSPYSIALTIAAYHWFSPSLGTLGGVPNDFDAMLKLATGLRENFHDGRLKVCLPVEPKVDLLATMSGKQMNDFCAQVDRLIESLRATRAAENLDEGLTILRREFGDDFPAVR
jgi:hypothetical protein